MMQHLRNQRHSQRVLNLGIAGWTGRNARGRFEPLEPKLLLFATGGDFNGDGIVAAADVVLVRTHWGALVEGQLDGWVGMQPDSRVDQNELDAVLLNWLQVVDPASEDSAAAPAASSVAGEKPPSAPAPLGEAALPSTSDNAENALTVNTQSQDAASATEAPNLRSVRDAAISAIVRGGAGTAGVKQVASSSMSFSQKSFADTDRAGGSGNGERDAAFAQAATGGWMSTARLGMATSMRGTR
jgi:hypothetical protein